MPCITKDTIHVNRLRSAFSPIGLKYSVIPVPTRSISLEGLRTFRAVSRRYRNRRVGEFLKELHLTEGRNTGFHKILRALRDNGSPDPVFETDEERSYFLTTIYAYQESAPAKTTQPLQHAANAREQGILNRRDHHSQYLANHPHTTLAQLSHELVSHAAPLTATFSH